MLRKTERVIAERDGSIGGIDYQEGRKTFVEKRKPAFTGR